MKPNIAVAAGRKVRWGYWVPALLAGQLLTGCVGALPVPKLSNRPVTGQIIHHDQVAFVVPELTTRAELVEHLGGNFVASLRQPALAYTWELPGGRGVWWFGSEYYATAGEFEWSRWRSFFVLFDDRGLVRRIQFKHLSSRHSLHEQLENWAQKAAL